MPRQPTNTQDTYPGKAALLLLSKHVESQSNHGCTVPRLNTTAGVKPSKHPPQSHSDGWCCQRNFLTPEMRACHNKQQTPRNRVRPTTEKGLPHFRSNPAGTARGSQLVLFRRGHGQCARVATIQRISRPFLTHQVPKIKQAPI